MYNFKVGNRVRIVRLDSGNAPNGKPFYRMFGFIERIDGAYHYVRPRWYKHVHELYRNEIELA